MDSDTRSPTDSVGAKASFYKPSHDPSNRKYRRRSPVSSSSSSDGESVERSSTTTHRKDDRRDIDRDYNRSRYNKDISSNRTSDRRSYDDRKHGDYKRREKYAEEDQKNFRKLSPHARGGSGIGSHANYSDHSRREFEQNRSRDNIDKYSRGRHRSRDKYKRDDVRDDKQSGRHHHKDPSGRDSKELDDPKYTRFEKGKSYDQETRGLKDRHFKEPRELLDDKSVLVAKKSKFSVDKDTENNKDANEVQLASPEQGQEFAGKANTEQDSLKDSDIDAAKIAAMKAAELVNRNLIGTGIMSTDQKKKLLWGSKKSTPTEETAHRWDTSMFSDRERKEKFKKLMNLRLHWCIWPIVGCERGCEGGAETGDTRQQESRREAERTPDGLRETVHCRPSSEGWPYCWPRPLMMITSHHYWSLLYLLLCSRNIFVVPHAFELCLTFKLLTLITVVYTAFLPAVDSMMD